MENFKTESKRILDLMINSIYTHKEIFLREVLSNSSDALDKLHYKSLTDKLGDIDASDLCVKIALNKDAREIRIIDNGIGMTKAELEDNLGTIAKSGSLAFKNSLDKKDSTSIIGQFGVGFYSTFMVSDKVIVNSKAYGEKQAYSWTSTGVDGYEITDCTMKDNGTEIILHIKPDTEDDNYSEYLEDYKLKSLITKYSNYIKYPIKMLESKKVKNDAGEEKDEISWNTINSMVPLWKKQKSEITKEEYDKFYSDMFYDENPLKTIHTSVEGAVNYKALLFIPSNAQYDYYTKEFEKGLKLYSNGVLIMDKCQDLLPDCFSFVRGLVDTDLDLNISRETIQHSRQLSLISKNIENKIKKELTTILSAERETYVKFYKAFGLQLEYQTYNNWGAKKDTLKELLMFKSVKNDKLVTLKEYIDAMKEEQKYIYYGTGKNVTAVKNLPQCESVLDKDYDVLCFTNEIDEFVAKILSTYEEKEFKNISNESIGLDTQEKEENRELTEYIKLHLGDKVSKVKISNRLKSHPICITNEGDVSLEMEKLLQAMPNANDSAKAQKVFEINGEHKIYSKIKDLYENDKDKLNELIDVLYAQAEIIAGIEIENPTNVVDKLCALLSE